MTEPHALIERLRSYAASEPGHRIDNKEAMNAAADTIEALLALTPAGTGEELIPDREAVEIWRLIEVLTDGEGDSVNVLCPNPDFNGQPAYAIDCNGGWTDWQDRRFADDRQVECFRKAVAALREASATPAPPTAAGDPWCSTCGKSTADISSALISGDCPVCGQWWKDNPPPTAAGEDEKAKNLHRSRLLDQIHFGAAETKGEVTEVATRLAKVLCGGNTFYSVYYGSPSGAGTDLEMLTTAISTLQAEVERLTSDYVRACDSIEPILADKRAAIARATAAEAKVTELQAEVGCCDGCGSTQTVAAIQASHPTAFTCCPERKMLTAAQWRARATAAEAQVRELREALERISSGRSSVTECALIARKALSPKEPSDG